MSHNFNNVLVIDNAAMHHSRKDRLRYIFRGERAHRGAGDSAAILARAEPGAPPIKASD